MVTLTVNGSRHGFDGDDDMPLLWYLRENLNLKGTKFGCGIAECGACTVLMDGSAVRACSVPMAAADGAEITTIEGLAASGELTAVQRAWVELDVPQCGYCQAGQIMAATDLLNQVPTPTDAEIDALMTNICRCGTYTRIRAAIQRAAEIGRDEA